MKTCVSFVVAVALAWAGAVAADKPVYKWVDDKGQVHYSFEPHSDNAKALSITTSTPATATTPAPTGATAAAQSYVDDATLTHPQPADTPACAAGRDRLFKYLHADSLYSVDDKGNKVNMPAADRAKALNEARDYVRQACGQGGY